MTMNDQERITDLILTEKKMSANYDTFASECVNVQLRDEFLKLLNQGHQTQTKLFQTAQQKGWYQVDQPDRHCLYPFQQPAPPVKPIHGARPFTGLALFKVETG
jgi:spore coat protein CotF